MKMKDLVKTLLEREQQRVQELEDNFDGGLYCTSPAGMRKVRLNSRRRMSLSELEALAGQGNFTDLNILQVVHDTYHKLVEKYTR
jgi:hypothetical protein